MTRREEGGVLPHRFERQPRLQRRHLARDGLLGAAPHLRTDGKAERRRRSGGMLMRRKRWVELRRRFGDSYAPSAYCSRCFTALAQRRRCHQPPPPAHRV